ncbi:hypothetical protein AAY473_031981 [Plecturocebus cupreus]
MESIPEEDAMNIFKISYLEYCINLQSLTLSPGARLECNGTILLTATSAFRIQAILLPQPPEYLGLQACTTMPNNCHSHPSIQEPSPQLVSSLNMEAGPSTEINIPAIGQTRWLTPVIPAFREPEEGGSRGQEIKTTLANMLFGRLRQENCLNMGGGGGSEPRSHHCTPAWRLATKQDSVSKKTTKKDTSNHSCSNC